MGDSLCGPSMTSWVGGGPRRGESRGRWLHTADDQSVEQSERLMAAAERFFGELVQSIVQHEKSGLWVGVQFKNLCNDAVTGCDDKAVR